MIGLLARTSEKTMTRKTLSPALALAACASLLAGCAQVPPNAGENPADPWEGFNRNVHAFNSTLDRAVAKPVAEAYVEWTPELVRKGVSNAVDNLGEPSNALNNTLQGKVDKGIGSLFRFLVNSTFGIAGLFDVAGEIGLAAAPEDFGQTLGVWGVGQGPYLELPLLGPSTVRDVTRYPVRWAAGPMTYVLDDEEWYWSAGLLALEGVDARARLLPLEAMRASTVDEYAAIRDAYLAARENAVRDGEKADEQEELGALTPLSFDDEDNEDGEEKSGAPAGVQQPEDSGNTDGKN